MGSMAETLNLTNETLPLAPDEDVATVRLLELRDLRDEVVAADDRYGSPYDDIHWLGGDHVLGDGVDVVGVEGVLLGPLVRVRKGPLGRVVDEAVEGGVGRFDDPAH